MTFTDEQKIRTSEFDDLCAKASTGDVDALKAAVKMYQDKVNAKLDALASHAERFGLNLDSVDADDLPTVAENLNKLTLYARIRITASAARKKGDIETALLQERVLEAIYSSLDPQFKW